MITKPLVLILGAGASRPYGFPMGREMVREATTSVSCEDEPLTIAGDLQQRGGVARDDFEGFQQAMKAALPPSIDAFIETRPQFEEIGKTVIAYLLIRRETDTAFYDREIANPGGEAWYGYLLDLLHTPTFDEFADNKLTIVTFNYDRSLEFCLLEALQSRYNRSREDCLAALESIPIIHLHGSLGSLDDRPYDDNVDYDRLQIARDGIRIVHQVDTNEPQFTEARSAMEQAEHMVFLGFGYHRKNIERLGLDGLVNRPTIWGTAYGFEPREKKTLIEPHVPGLQGRHLTDHTVLGFLRNHRDLFG